MLEAAQDPRYRQSVLACGSQLAKTQGMLAQIGRRLDDDPTPILYVGPSRHFVETRFEPRLRTMLYGSESLSAKLAKGKAEKKTAKLVAGVMLRLAWGGSATELSGDPIGLAFVDERDRMGPTEEGDVVELAETRGQTYPDFHLAVFSTPRVGTVQEEQHPETGMIHWRLSDRGDVESPIWRLFEGGTRSEWAWPCPRCGAYFVPRFSRIVFDSKDTLEVIEREAKMRCPECERTFGTERKTEMNARGRYVSPGQTVTKQGVVEGRPIESRTASHWASGLISPWRTFGQATARYIKAVRSGDPHALQVVVNTELGELYRVRGEAPKWETVAARREPYSFGEVADAVRTITIGVDVGKQKFDYVVRGWAHGRQMESWLLHAGEIWRDTDTEDAYQALSELLHQTWGARQIPCSQMLVDSGWRPGDKWKRPEHRVYDFCRRFPGWARASKGFDVLDQPVKLVQIDYTTGNQRIPKAVELVHVNTDHMKSWIHGRLEWPAGQPGTWHISRDASDAYCAEIVAEGRLVTAAGRARWIRTGPNHHFDAEVLALAGAWLFGVPLMGQDTVPQGSENQAPQLVVRSRHLRR